jgi:heat shock protein HtpX
MVVAAAVITAAVVLTVAIGLALAVWRALAGASGSSRLPLGAVVLVLVLPVVTFAIAAAGSRFAAGRTFQAQAAANRRNSLFLLVTLVGVVAATAEIVAGTVTFNPVPALWAGGIAALVGLGAAVGADRFGADVILQTAGARPADPVKDAVLLNVVREIALSAGLPEPRCYVIEDRSQNAFATGRDPQHAAVAVTRGLLDSMDREQLQGVIGHELGHVRNLDTRYALYVAVLVGLVALVTDGFLRAVVEGWRQGAFFWSDDDAKGAIAAFISGILVGIFLLVVAALLRVVAPLFSALVQAAVSRQREFLADATSVELTRNPIALERALLEIATDRDALEAANRGTQHLWFRNPIGDGSDRGPGILSTHPSIGARVERLRQLRGLDMAAIAAPASLDEET